jgi:hypothetical protein
MIVLRSRRPRSSYRPGVLTKVRFSIKTQLASANGDAGARKVRGWLRFAIQLSPYLIDGDHRRFTMPHDRFE